MFENLLKTIILTRGNMLQFCSFIQCKCTFGEINVDLCFIFLRGLLTAPQGLHKNRKLHINSAANYRSTDDKPSAIKLVLIAEVRRRKPKGNFPCFNPYSLS